MDYTRMISEISKYVAAYFSQYENPNLLYHNYRHTLKVVERVAEIRAFYPLTETEIFVLEAAAWFHDIGQLTSNGQNHEEIGISIMQDYLHSFELPKETVQGIEQCILATKVPHKPTSLSDEIICDADTYNLGTDEFLVTDALLKREYELRGLSTENWDENTLQFLSGHQYFTVYCQHKLNATKNKNITLVRERV